jgi:hypothetical protein
MSTKACLSEILDAEDLLAPKATLPQCLEMWLYIPHAIIISPTIQTKNA